MITSVTFDDTIPYAIDRRDSRFDVDFGWAITEEAPGRVRLRRTDLPAGPVNVIVQSMPYTLQFGPDPEPGEGIGGLISEATLGDVALQAEQVFAAGTRAQASLNRAQRRGRP